MADSSAVSASWEVFNDSLKKSQKKKNLVLIFICTCFAFSKTVGAENAPRREKQNSVIGSSTLPNVLEKNISKGELSRRWYRIWFIDFLDGNRPEMEIAILTTASVAPHVDLYIKLCWDSTWDDVDHTGAREVCLWLGSVVCLASFWQTWPVQG